MSYFLRITLLSPLASSSGEGWANQVDSDIPYDDTGLPLLPGRRIKGLLREALSDVVDACSLSGFKVLLEIENRVFGKPGAGSNGQSLVSIHDARPEGFTVGTAAAEGLRHLCRHRAITAQEILASFSAVRGQTAIDSHSGTASENTLRFTRVVQKGYVFIVPLKLSDNRAAKPLALAAAALKEAGLSRTRGYGRIECRLIQDQDDLTERLLENEAPFACLSPDKWHDEIPEQKNTQAVKEHKGLGQSPCLLRYRIKLLADTLLPESGADPNSMTSAACIAGPIMNACFASAFLKKTGGQPAAKGEPFRQLFWKNPTMFLNANPEGEDHTGGRLLPVPHSLRMSKAGGFILDFSQEPSPLASTRLAGSYLRFDGTLARQACATRLHYHHTRAKDRRYGRALGSDTPQGGALFSYETLKAGQTFIGAVIGSANDLNCLQQLLPDGSELRIGRSKSAQYGMTELSWIDDSMHSYNGDLAEWKTWEEMDEREFSGKTITLTCLSPLLTRNDNGHSSPVFPVQELAEQLGVSLDDLCLKRSWTMTRQTGGFHSHLKLPDLQWPAIDAGSVFQFSIPSDSIARERIAPLEARGIGLRRKFGFGRIAVNLHGPSPSVYQVHGDNIQLMNMDRPRTGSISLDHDDPLSDILSEVLVQRAYQTCEKEARKFAGLAKNIPTSSTLSRLALLLRQENWHSMTLPDLNNFKRHATDSLKNCRAGEQSLWKTIIAALEKYEEIGMKAIELQLGAGGSLSWKLFFNEESLALILRKAESKAAELTRYSMLALVRELIRKNRI